MQSKSITTAPSRLKSGGCCSSNTCCQQTIQLPICSSGLELQLRGGLPEHSYSTFWRILRRALWKNSLSPACPIRKTSARSHYAKYSGFWRDRQISYGIGGGERLFSFQNTIYPSYRKGISNNTYLHSQVWFWVVWGFFYFYFVVFEEEREEEEHSELKEFHSWHAKASSRNAWIFHGGLDMCYSKRSRFTMSPALEGTHFRSLSFREKGLLPFSTESPSLHVGTCTAPAQTASRLFSQPWGLRTQTSRHFPQKGIKSMMMFKVDYYGLK